MRWSILAAGVGLALMYLNSAAGSAWVAGGPPTPYPEAWLHRAFAHLCFSAVTMLVALALFRWLKLGMRPDRVVLLLVVLSALALSAPHVRKLLLENSCVNSGGVFDSLIVRCAK